MMSEGTKVKIISYEFDDEVVLSLMSKGKTKEVKIKSDLMGYVNLTDINEAINRIKG